VEIQTFAGTALYLFLSENIWQTPAISCPFTAFLCRECIFCWGWLWLFSIGSKQWFCDRKLWLIRADEKYPPTMNIEHTAYPQFKPYWYRISSNGDDRYWSPNHQ